MSANFPSRPELRTYSSIFPPLAKIASYGNVTLPELWGVNPFLLVAVFVMLCLLLFYFLENGLRRGDKLEPPSAW